jgi:cytochrome c oxidase subunit 2
MFTTTSPSDIARQVDSAMLILVVVCLVLLVGITATMIFFVVKYRRSKVRRTKQIHGNLPLEVVWTVVPTAIAVGLFFVGYEGFLSMRSVPAGAMEVRVTGQQWFWSFNYPEYGITSRELYVPVGRPVKFTITAPTDDVLHSFYIPAFRVKEDVVPGMETTMWIEARQAGTYHVFCAEFCGAGHSSMLSKMHVVAPAEYQAWLQRKVEERYRPVDPARALHADAEELKQYDGKALFAQYCAACHGSDGKGGGPYQARDLTSLEGWKRGTKLTDIFTTVSRGLPDTQMRSFGHLPVRERFAVMHHVASFNTSGQRLATTEQDMAKLKREIPEADPSNAVPAPALKPVVPIEQAMDEVVAEGASR